MFVVCGGCKEHRIWDSLTICNDEIVNSFCVCGLEINSVAFSNEDKKECCGLVNGHLALFITRL